MNLELDHVVWAAPDLEAACASFEEATGCRPVAGGPHPGMGTRNALAGLGPGRYLELLAPDPAQSEPAGAPVAWLAAWLRKLTEPVLFHWALRSHDLGAVAASLREAGLDPTPAIPTRRQRPDGLQLAWELMGLPGRGGAWPFFIDWRDCPHPSRDAPVAGALRELRVTLPVDEPGALPFADVDGVRLGAGAASLSLRFESERGAVSWRQAEPAGFFR